MITTKMRICKEAHCRHECVEVTNCVIMDEEKKRRLIDNIKISMFNLKSLLQIIDFV